MKLYTENIESINRQKEVVIEHKGESIRWDFSSAYKGLKVLKHDVSEHINQYFDKLDEQKLDNIFSVYKEIRYTFDEVFDRKRLTQALIPLVTKLIDQFDLDNIQYWIMNKSDILIPNETVIKVNYVSSPDISGTREQTYIREDYVKLISLCLMLRCMLPIWGEYITKTHSEIGTKFKEQDAFRLMSASSAMSCEAMLKLKTYIQYATLAGKKKMSSIVDGVSSEDFPDWMLSLVVIKRLCVIDLRGIDAATSIPSQIYGFISQKVHGLDTKSSSGIGIIKSKEFSDDNQKGDQNISRLESYKAKQEISPGDIVALEFAASDPYIVFQKLAPGVSIDLLTSALKTTEVLNIQRLYEPQIVLLQWVIKRAIPTRAVDYLTKATVVKLLAVCQAVLWHKGHKELAALCTAVVQPRTEEMHTSGNDSRAKIPKEMVDELDFLFPFKKRPAGKQKNVKLVNQAIANIFLIDDQFSGYNWVFTIEQKFLKELTSTGGHRRYFIPHNFKILLAALVLDLSRLKI